MSALGGGVFPRPREATPTGGRGRPVETAVETAADLPAQGYELIIDREGTRVRHADEPGLGYARQTIAQLAAADELPAGRIRDWPDFAHRGFMLDVSRDRVPTMETLEWLVGRLAELRYNHLELYVEHTFAYADHEVVWRNASPITAEELRQLDDTCEAHGIELSANQNTFGHMQRWLSHPQYRARAECPDGSELTDLRMTLPPWSFEPTPGNAAFATDLVREMASYVRSRRVHVGADEPFDLGLGRSRALVQQRGRAAVFVEHLRRIVDPLLADGYEVLFWGDALVRHPEQLAHLPAEGAAAVVWNYEAPDPSGPAPTALLGTEPVELLGLPDDANLGFRSFVAPYVAVSYPFWVAPGTSSWNSILGRWTNARGNLLDAAVVGRDAGAPGYLVADWGDNGHHQPLPVSLLPAAYGAGVSWCEATNRDVDVSEIVDGLLEADPGIGGRLAQLGDVYRELGVSAVNGSPLFFVMSKRQTWPLRGRVDRGAAERAERLIGEALDQVASNPFSGARAEVTAAELVAAYRLVRHGLWRLHQQRRGRPVDREILARDYDEVVVLHRQAWLAGSRPGGLDDSVAELESV